MQQIKSIEFFSCFLAILVLISCTNYQQKRNDELDLYIAIKEYTRFVGRAPSDMESFNAYLRQRSIDLPHYNKVEKLIKGKKLFFRDLDTAIEYQFNGNDYAVSYEKTDAVFRGSVVPFSVWSIRTILSEHKLQFLDSISDSLNSQNLYFSYPIESSPSIDLYYVKIDNHFKLKDTNSKMLNQIYGSFMKDVSNALAQVNIDSVIIVGFVPEYLEYPPPPPPMLYSPKE